MGLSGAAFPSVSVEDPDGLHHYAFPEHAPIERNAIVAHIRRYLAGELRPALRSEPPPLNTEDTDGVTVLVGSTFTAQVLGSERDVMVELTTPWCAHCARVSPMYAELARVTRDVRTLVVAKIDVSVNDVPAGLFRTDKFPRFYFVPARPGSAPLLYEGSLTVTSMLSFIQSHAAHRVNVTFLPEGPEEDLRSDPLLFADDKDEMEHALKGEHLQLQERVRVLEALVRELQSQVKTLKKQLVDKDKQRPGGVSPSKRRDEL
eukprot:Hpha_TRINITY_DN30364_c0_g1::TRINITY_DN30364_c0_g1_i1::g.147048::m.147048